MRLVTLVAVMAVASAACDDSPTAPMAQTRIDARVRDLSFGKLGTPVPVPTVTGTLSGNFAASIWDGSRWVSLGSPNGITVEMQVHVANPDAAPTTVHGEKSAPPGSYDRVRLVLQGVTATIARGSGFGGITLSTDATFRLGGSDHYVELSDSVVPFSLGDAPLVRRVIVFDLNSPQWLTSSAAQSGQVEDAALQAAISASTSLESR